MIHVFYHYHRQGHDIYLVRGELPTIAQLIVLHEIDFEPDMDEYIEYEYYVLEGDIPVQEE